MFATAPRAWRETSTSVDCDKDTKVVKQAEFAIISLASSFKDRLHKHAATSRCVSTLVLFPTSAKVSKISYSRASARLSSSRKVFAERT